MNMMFFKIGSTDLSQYADIQNYNINEADVFQSWTDGNWIDHRDMVRTRITGTVLLGFKTAASWSAFQTLLASQRNASGYYPVTLYVNNTGTTETIDAFLDMTNATKWDLVNDRFWRVQTVKVTER